MCIRDSIGTPPNIIIASYRAEVSGEPFSMFDFSPVGFFVALVGLAFITIVGWRFIPTNRNSKDGSETLFEISHYLTEIVIKPGSPLVGELLKDNEIFSSENVDVVGMAQKNGFARPIPLQYRFAEEDVLLVQSDPSHMQSIVEETVLSS